MSGRRLVTRGAAALTLTVLAAGCGGGPAGAPGTSTAPSSSVAMSPPVTASPAAPLPSPSAPASQSASAPASQSASASASASASGSAAPAPTPPATKKRTVAELRKALLGLKDVPAGFEVESGSTGGGGKASSGKSECAPLVRLLNASQVPGSRAAAQVSFSGGQAGPFVDESLDALGTAKTAGDFVGSYRSAVRKCRTISLRIDGAGTSPLEVREISFADVGDTSFAARFRASRGDLAGFELIQAGVQSADVLIGMTFVDLDPTVAEAATQDAVKKVEDKLGTSGGI